MEHAPSSEAAAELCKDVNTWAEVRSFNGLTVFTLKSRLAFPVVEGPKAPSLSWVECSSNFWSLYFQKQMLHTDCDKLGGEVLLEGEQILYKTRKETENWTRAARKLFARHLDENGSNSSDNDNMLKLNLVSVLLIISCFLFRLLRVAQSTRAFSL